MLRRFLVILIRRSLLILLLVCLGCVAQSAPPDVARQIEHQVRAFYTIPPEVKVTVGAITPSTDWPGYDAVSVNIDGGDGKQKDYKFLLSKDRATMHGDQALALRFPDPEAGVGHAEWREQMVAQVGVEPLPTCCFHRLADEIEIGAVLPARAEIGRAHV